MFGVKKVFQAVKELISPSKEKPGDKMSENLMLFRRPDGKPIVFTSSVKEKVERLIKLHGGEFIPRARLASHPEKDHVIKLVSSREIPITKNLDQDLFDFQYIEDCVEQGELIDLNVYMVTDKSLFANYDVMTIVNGNAGWKDLDRLDIGAKVSDIDDSDEEETRPPKKKHMKANRMLYCKNEQKEIIDWIVESGAFKSLKGNEIWKKMEAENVGRGRTWQSLREHFRKTIIGQIHTFQLSAEIQDNFKVAMGVKQDTVVSARIRSMGSSAAAANAAERKSPANDHVEKICFICGPRVEGIRKLNDHGYVCENCSRPSTSIFAAQSIEEDNVSGKNSELDALLGDSDIADVDLSDEITKGSIAEEEMPTFSKSKRRLYSQKMHDTPVESSFSERRKKWRINTDIEDLPSSQDFVRGLKEVRDLASSNDEDVSGLTSTQNLLLGSDVEMEAVSLRQSPRLKVKAKVDWSHVKIIPSKKEKMKKNSNDIQQDDNQEQENFEDTDDEEYQPDNSEEIKNSNKKKKRGITLTKKKNKSDKKTVTPERKNPRKKKSPKATNRRSQSPNDQDFLPSQNLLASPSINLPAGPSQNLQAGPSQNLLERHLQDQLNFRESQVDTENLVDALNNIDDEPPLTGGPTTPSKQRLRHGLFETRSDRWETDTIKSGRFFNEGEFSANFRLPYSSSEEKAMVNFFLNEGGYRIRKGRAIWMKMAIMKVCNGRTWQSMKGRWEKYVSKDLKKFNVSHEDLIEADRRIFGEDGASEQEGDIAATETANFRGVRSGRKFYSREEDLKIINFLLENRRYQDVKGRAIWQLLEERDLVPGRSWHSLKERYIKVIRKNIRERSDIYDLETDQAQRLRF